MPGPGHFNCCVVGCANSYYTLLKWQQQMCDLHGDFYGGGKCTCSDPFSWISFPSDPATKAHWLKLINRQGFTVKKHTRICSRHFKDGRPSEEYPYPTEQMGYELGAKPKGRKKIVRTAPALSSATKRKNVPRDSSAMQDNASEFSQDSTSKDNPTSLVSNHTSSDLLTLEIPPNDTVLPINDPESCPNQLTAFLDHTYTFSGDTSVKFDEMEDEDPECCAGCSYREATIVKLKCENRQLKKQISHWKVKYNEKHSKPFGYSSVTTDKCFRSFTGIPTKKAFDCIYDVISPRVNKIRKWKGSKTVCNIVRKYRVRSPKKHGNKSFLLGKDEMLLTLMKLRLNLPLSILAILFGVVEGTISRIWNTWVIFLSREFATINPEADFVRASLPPSFRNSRYSKVRHIIDCSEVFIETPKQFQTRSLTWSDYKHHNTLKFLVSINPNGYINYVSDAWGGRASDSHITMNCGFQDILQPYDVIMADKGFSSLSSWLAQLHCVLLVPPGKCGETQFSKSDVIKTKDIANRRIHVEQAIRRLKTFKIIKDELPISLIPNINHILRICQFISNLLGPIAKTQL